MKVAILLHPLSLGGVSRFQKILLGYLAKNNPKIKIDVFAGKEIIERDCLNDFIFSNISVYCLEKFNVKTNLSPLDINKKNTNKKRNKINIITRDFLKQSKVISSLYFFIKHSLLRINIPWYKFKLNKLIMKELNSHDIVYLPAISFIKPFKLNIPIVGTLHDFNWKHNFTGNFNQEMIVLLEKQTKQWVEILNTAINSTKFIRNEFINFYPNAKCRKKVVYLTTFNQSEIDGKKSQAVLKKFNVPKEYIICPGRIAVHKNVPSLLKAMERLIYKLGVRVPLILTGDNSNLIKLKYDNFSKSSPLYEVNKFLSTSKLKLDKDIYHLGYVSDEEIDALISRASLVVSPSLYEAGSGPAIDAWHVGAPIAFSSIPPFLEQLDFLKTKAWIFDPKDPKNIAEVMEKAIKQKEKSKEMTKESKEAIDKYTWDDVAKQYYEVFEKAVLINKKEV